MTKPVIAAVNGFAMGGGFEIALACHLVVADESAQFALSEVRVGLIAGAGGIVRLPRAIPPKIATELILTGRRSTRPRRSASAWSAGWPAGSDPCGGPRPGRGDSVGLSDLGATVAETHGRDPGHPDTVEAVDAPSDAIDELLTSADMIEGMTAFAMKRTPEWKNQ